ncbi:DUF5683 domain-containing protein [Taibaiella soli]|uniref:DUF5683 domain-containing protein n=1 Tax=Taibaiella soli TaxID=1649169 RepID=A0A2W2ADM0_9BACT|nr:DUF5683 domain-containing protein [Taibaiella soli]PZF73545.1 hypothetical protein DN068_07415 [Taibaiella soli]
MNSFLRFSNRFLGLMPVMIVCFLCIASQTFAQATPDTSLNRIIPDTAQQATPQAVMTPPPPVSAAELKNEPFQPNPKKSGLYSSILPGAGQLYNRQYWKIPIIYVGVGVAGYFIVDNLKNYRNYRKIYIARLQGDHSDGLPYSDADIKTLQDAYSKYLNMTVLFTAVGYALQIVDAITFAHLKNFDISRDISMRMVPIASPYGVGLGVVFQLK